MKLALDCRFIGRSGIGAYIENTTTEMLTHHPEHEYVLFGDPATLARWAKQENCTVVECLAKPFSIGELLRFPVAEVNKCDAFYTPDFNIPMGIKVPITSMIHDVVFFESNDAWSLVHRLILKLYISRALKISRNVVTVSAFSKSRIEHFFPFRTDIQVVGSSISRKLKAYKASHKSAEQREGIVFLGNLKKNKGIEILLRAYNKLELEGWHKPLTLIGKMDFRTKDSSVAELVRASKGKVKLVSDATDEDVYRIVSGSEVLVSPSLYEGFGLPPLEALYLGTPVIISDIPVYKEVYAGLPVTFFQSGNPDDLADKLRSFDPAVVDIAAQIDEKYNISRFVDFILNMIGKNLDNKNV